MTAKVINSRFSKGLTKIKAIIQETDAGLIQKGEAMHRTTPKFGLTKLPWASMGLSESFLAVTFYAAYKLTATVKQISFLNPRSDFD